jgi:hypothetical protein
MEAVMVRKSGRITRAITIDSGLDARMRKTTGVNWSAVASVAFEQELLSRRRMRTMASVIERLRASKEASATEFHRAGVSAGEEWAKNSAEYDELHLLGENQASLHELIPAGADHGGRAGERFVFAIHPELAGDTQAAARFWEFALDEELVEQAMMDSDEFVRGFTEGALALWNEVRDQI